MKNILTLSLITIAALGIMSEEPDAVRENEIQILSSKYIELEAKIEILEGQNEQLMDYFRELHKDAVGLIPIPSVEDEENKPASCDDVWQYDSYSDSHTLFLSDNSTVKVYCDQSTYTGGWAVIQRRQDGSEDFYRNYEMYEIGFGDVKKEFWIGLDNLYQITKGKNFKLRIDLTDFDGNSGYAVYNTFHINGPDDNYRLTVGEFEGNAGDSLSYHNNMQFSAYDKDNDVDPDNCAQRKRAGWWFTSCVYGNLNGRYSANDVSWYYWKSDWRSMKHVEIKIKRKYI